MNRRPYYLLSIFLLAAFLKKRIRSSEGHLSNAECSSLLSQLLHGGLQTVVLGHLSEINNTPRLALHTVCGALTRRGATVGGDVALDAAPADEPGALYIV